MIRLQEHGNFLRSQMLIFFLSLSEKRSWNLWGSIFCKIKKRSTKQLKHPFCKVITIAQCLQIVHWGFSRTVRWKLQICNNYCRALALGEEKPFLISLFLHGCCKFVALRLGGNSAQAYSWSQCYKISINLWFLVSSTPQANSVLLQVKDQLW